MMSSTLFFLDKIDVAAFPNQEDDDMNSFVIVDKIEVLAFSDDEEVAPAGFAMNASQEAQQHKEGVEARDGDDAPKQNAAAKRNQTGPNSMSRPPSCTICSAPSG